MARNEKSQLEKDMNSKWFQEEFSQNLEISDSNSNDSDVEIIGANFNVNEDNVSKFIHKKKDDESSGLENAEFK